VNRVFDQDVYKMTTSISGLWWFGKANAISKSETVGSLNSRKPIFFLKKHYFLYFHTTVIGIKSL